MLGSLKLSTLAGLDKTGIACSGACAIHCLFLPIIAFMSPTISSFLHNEWIHISLLLILVPVALVSFSKSYNVHGNLRPAIFGSLGITLLFSALVVESLHLEITMLGEALTGVGSALLILGHALNINCLRRL